jgi:cell division protein FtsB
MFRVREWLRHEALSLILGALLIATCLNAALAPRGVRDLLALRHYAQQLEAARELLQNRNHQLQSTVEKLKSDDSYIQRAIRKELGFAHSNELIYRFARESQAPSPGAP